MVFICQFLQATKGARNHDPQVKLSLEPFYSCRLQSLTVLLFFFPQVCITDLYYCINQLRTIYLGLSKLFIEMDHIRHAFLLVHQCFFFNFKA